MISDNDIDVATEQGILSPAQAAALRALAAERQTPVPSVWAHEERFRFMRGFNDFFFAIGIVLLGSGMAFFAGTTPFMRSYDMMFASGPITASRIAAIALANAFAALIVWALAELLVKRMRLVLPGILLAGFFVLFAYMAIPFELLIGTPTLASPETWSSIAARASTVATSLIIFKALVAATAAALFYERFRLPFALMLVAGALVVVAAATLKFLYAGNSEAVQSTLLLFCGLAVFAAAMRFDISDPERLSRRADCAFWLHLLAAPLIVHSLISFVAPDRFAINASTALMMFGIVVGLAVVSIVIDRRALFVSALAYLGAVIGYALTHAAGHQIAYRAGNGSSFTFFATLVILGIVVVALGVGWMPLRRGLIAILPVTLTRRFPAVPVRS